MKSKILIVDDDPNTLRATAYALETQGYEAITAHNGSEALLTVERERPDLVILDVMMPDMTGIEVCQRLRSDERTARLPVIMVSAKGQPGDKVTGIRAGADDYVTKPVDLAELIARMERLMVRTSQVAAPSPKARALAFTGAKGGVGTTTVAVSVAVALADLGKSVILVDLHRYLGSVNPLLGLESAYAWGELLATEGQTLGRQQVVGALASHSSGLRVLAGDHDSAVKVPAELATKRAEVILGVLDGVADWVLFDFPLSISSDGQAVLDRCDLVALVTGPDPIALDCARKRLAQLRKCGVTGDRIGAIVVNRLPSGMRQTVDELQQLLGVAIVGVVPPASDACLRAESEGVPLVTSVRQGFVSKMLRDMAQRLVAEPGVE